MPASTIPSPSRRRAARILDLDTRLTALTHELDTLPDRRAPLEPLLFQRGWRLVDELRRRLRLAPIPPRARGRSPFDLVWQVLLISGLLTPAKALGIKGSRRAKQKSYPRASARE